MKNSFVIYAVCSVVFLILSGLIAFYGIFKNPPPFLFPPYYALFGYFWNAIEYSGFVLTGVFLLSKRSASQGLPVSFWDKTIDTFGNINLGVFIAYAIFSLLFASERVYAFFLIYFPIFLLVYVGIVAGSLYLISLFQNQIPNLKFYKNLALSILLLIFILSILFIKIGSWISWLNYLFNPSPGSNLSMLPPFSIIAALIGFSGILAFLYRFLTGAYEQDIQKLTPVSQPQPPIPPSSSPPPLPNTQ